MPSYSAYLAQTFATLVAVCALAFAVLWGARRLGLAKSSGAIELCGHLPLEGRRAIYLVKVGDTLFVVAAGESGVTKIGEMPARDVPLPGRREAPTFRTVLARARDRAVPRGDGAPPTAAVSGAADPWGQSRR